MCAGVGSTLVHLGGVTPSNRIIMTQGNTVRPHEAFTPLKPSCQHTCAKIMALPGEMIEDAIAQCKAGGRAYPPTVFVHMTRDHRTSQGVELDVRVLAGGGVPTKEVRVDPTPLTPTRLYEAIGEPEVGQKLSEQIFNAFK